jgi:hypothetical protein
MEKWSGSPPAAPRRVAVVRDDRAASSLQRGKIVESGTSASPRCGGVRRPLTVVTNRFFVLVGLDDDESSMPNHVGAVARPATPLKVSDHARRLIGGRVVVTATTSVLATGVSAES